MFFLFLHKKTYIVSTHKKHLGKALLMDTNNLYFYVELEKII